MKVCDRHKDRQAAHTLVVSPTESYDLCNPCAEEMREWIAGTPAATPANEERRGPGRPRKSNG